MSNPEHFLIIASPMRPVPMIAMVLPVTSSPRNGRNGCHDGHFCSRTSRSLAYILRASIPIMKNANSAVASVSTSAVFVNGILYLLASARLMLSKPTAICATTLSDPFPGLENLGIDRIAQRRDQAHRSRSSLSRRSASSAAPPAPGKLRARNRAPAAGSPPDRRCGMWQRFVSCRSGLARLLRDPISVILKIL